MFVRPRHRRAPGALTRPVDRRLVEAGLPTCKAPPSNPATSNARCRGRHRSIDDASAWLEPEAVDLFRSRLRRLLQITPTCAEILVAADSPPEMQAIFRETAARPCVFLATARGMPSLAQSRSLLGCEHGPDTRRLTVFLAIVADLPGDSFVAASDLGPVLSVERIAQRSGWF